MSYGKHSARHGKRTLEGRHSLPRKKRITGKHVSAIGIALALSAVCVPGGLALAQPMRQTAAGTEATQMSETPQAQVMTAQEKASIDRILGKHELTTGQKAVKIARQFLGTPYVWGGASPAGFDCSGLTQYVYGKLGVGLEHFAQTQFSQGKRIASNALKAGDLVFFGGDGSINHVGIYVGKGGYLHAPQTGDVVRISSLSERSDYVGACRPA